eukprot:356311-Chlamydomonas_euryale.AAC.2
MIPHPATAHLHDVYMKQRAYGCVHACVSGRLSVPDTVPCPTLPDTVPRPTLPDHWSLPHISVHPKRIHTSPTSTVHGAWCDQGPSQVPGLGGPRVARDVLASVLVHTQPQQATPDPQSLNRLPMRTILHQEHWRSRHLASDKLPSPLLVTRPAVSQAHAGANVHTKPASGHGSLAETLTAPSS